MQRSEWIIRDFRPRSRNGADQGGFTRIGQPQQAHIGDQFQLELQFALLTGQPETGLARRSIGTGFEAGVSPPALAAFGDQQRLAFEGQIAQGLAGVLVGDHGADRDGDECVIAAVTGAVIAAAALAILAPIGARNTKVRKRVHALDRFQVNTAAETAVAAVGAAEGHELFAPETHAAAAAVAGLHLEFGFVDKFHDGSTKN